MPTTRDAVDGGSFLTGVITVDPTIIVEWLVPHPVRPIFFNGLHIGIDGTFVDKGPTADPGFTVINPPLGNPTGNSNIVLNGFKLGANGTLLDETPPRGEVGGGGTAPPGPPTGTTPAAPTTLPTPNASEAEQAFMTRCTGILMAAPDQFDQADATEWCAYSWAANPAAASAQAHGAPGPLRPPPPRHRPKPRPRPKK